MLYDASTVHPTPPPGGTGVPAGGEFGNLLSQRRGATSTGSITNPLRYVGRLGYYDHTTGPLCIRARWLQPTTGSWLSVDPAE